MKVYALQKCFIGTGDEIIGIFDSLEKAKEAQYEVNKKYREIHNSNLSALPYDIIEYNLNKINW